jgi:hypothetical protein
VLLREARTLWFFGDDFDFLLLRSLTLTGPHGLLVPHNEHWSTLPIVLFRMSFAMFGMRHYLPYALLPIGFHLVVSFVLYLLLRRSQIRPWVAVLATLVVLFIGGGAGAENTLWDFQTGFLGSCAFGVFGLWLLDHEGLRWRLMGVAALVLALMSSGMGLLMVFWAGSYQLYRRGVRAALLTVCVPALTYLLWYAAFGHDHQSAPPMDAAIAPAAAMKGLGDLWSTATGLPGAGPTILGLMAIAVALPRTERRVFALGASGLTTLVVAYLLIGFTRSFLGIEAATASRYLYFGVVFSVPAIAVAIDLAARSLAPRPWAGAVAWGLLAAIAVSVGIAETARFRDGREGQMSDTKERLVAAARLVIDGQQVLRTLPSPAFNPNVDVGLLRRAAAEGTLPEVSPSRQAFVNAAVNLQVDVREADFSFGAPDAVTWQGFAGPAQSRGNQTGDAAGCVVRRGATGATLEISTGKDPVQLRMAVSGDELTTIVRSGPVSSEPVRWASSPGRLFYLGVTAPDQTVIVQVPSGDVTVCQG